MSIKGLDTFLDVFEIIKNPVKYEAKIEELRKVTAQYKETVEAVVALAGVNDYVLSIRDREEASKKELEAAKVAATEIKAKANEVLKDASEKLKEAQASKAQAQSEWTAMKEALDNQSKEVAKQTAELLKEKQAFEVVKKQLADEKAALKEKQDKLAAALK
jgi:chromosome segregation ATPase